jgi:hypothetical protein
MKSKELLLVYLCIIITLSGCAFGRKIPFEKMQVDLSFSGSKSIALSVADQREMVVDGSQKPDFVGYTRSGVGIAYPMGTQSGKSFAQVFQETVSRSFKNKGYSVLVIPASQKDSLADIKVNAVGISFDRLILFKINKMHSDFYAATIYYYDVDVAIYDFKGNMLVTKNFQKEKNIGGSAWGTGKYQEYTPAYLQSEIESWLNDKEISDNLM